MKKIISAILLFMLVLICIIGTKPANKRNNEAVESLTKVYELEQAHRAMFGYYTDNIYAIIFIQDTLVTDGGKANYLISLDEATDSTFKATAISVIDFDGDGQFSQWQVDETGIIIEIAED